MVQPILPSDRTGYIYALELACRCCGNTFPVRVCLSIVRVQTLPSPTSLESRSGGLWTSARVCHSIASDARRPSPNCLDSSLPRRRLKRLACGSMTDLNGSFTSNSLSFQRTRTRLHSPPLTCPASTVSIHIPSRISSYLTHLQAAHDTLRFSSSSACAESIAAKNGP